MVKHMEERITDETWRDELIYVVRILNAIFASKHNVAPFLRRALAVVCDEESTVEERDRAIVDLDLALNSGTPPSDLPTDSS